MHLILKQYAKAVQSHIPNNHHQPTYYLDLDESVSNALFPKESSENLSKFFRNKTKELVMIIILTLYLNRNGYKKVKGPLTSLKEIFTSEWMLASASIKSVFLSTSLPIRKSYGVNHETYWYYTWTTHIFEPYSESFRILKLFQISQKRENGYKHYTSTRIFISRT